MADAELGAGETIGGKYRIIRALGRGGFGTVYLVEITAGMVGEKLALKMLPSHLSAKESVRNQFINEIRVAMRLVDKYIIQIRDVGVTDDDHLYYTMDYSPGVTLKEVLRSESKLTPARAVPLVLRVLRALQTAHSRGVIHRDLKPANLMVEQRDDTETIRVLDFGIATAVQSEPSPEKGKFAGSPHYMPPEQFLDERLGFYTDLYAVGVILYECLTGQRPHQGKTPQEVYDDLKSRPAVSPTEFSPELREYPRLVQIILKALERNPEKRFQTAKAFFDELNEVAETLRRQEVKRQRRLEPATAAKQSAAVRAPRGSRRRTSVARARRRNPVGAGVVAAAIILALGVVAVIFRGTLLDSFNKRTVVSNGGGSDRETGPDDGTGLTEATPIDRPAPSPVPSPEETAAAAEERVRQYMADAVAAFEAEKWFEVRERCNDALTVDHTNATAYRLRGLAEVQLELWADAVSSLQLAIDYRPIDEKTTAEIYLALARAKQRETPSGGLAAQVVLREALDMHPDNGEIAAALASLLDAQGDEGRIVSLLQELHGRVEHPVVEALHRKWLVEIPEQRRREREELIAAAEAAFEARQYDVVIEKLARPYEEEPDPDLGLKLAVAWLETGDVTRALGVLGDLAPEVAADDASLAMVAILFGRAHLRAYEKSSKPEDLEHARMNLSSAKMLVDSKAELDARLGAMTVTYLARCAAHQGNLVQLDADVRSVRSASNGHPELIFHQGESYYILAKKTKDPTAFRRAISRLADYTKIKNAPRAGEAYYLQGLAYLSLGRNRSDFRDANNCFATARDRSHITPELYNAWAEAVYNLGDLSRAGKYYRESYTLRPQVETCYWAAKYFIEAGLTASAKEILDEGIRQLQSVPDSSKLRDLRRALGS